VQKGFKIMILRKDIVNKNAIRSFNTYESRLSKKYKNTENENNFDYSESIYGNAKKDMMIIRCKKHDHKFERTPNGHLSGKGCPICDNETNKRKIKEKRKKKFMEGVKIFEGRYGFNLSNLEILNDKVGLICEKHGEISIKASRILKGWGCPKCRHKIDVEKKPLRKLWDLNKFLSEVKKRRGIDYFNLFDYNESIYKGNLIKLKIRCKKHNITFEQSPSTHLEGKISCPTCKIRQGNGFTLDDLKEKMNRVHNNFYNYDFVKLKDGIKKTDNGKNFIKIICPFHGMFEQRQDHHLSGQTCKKCKDEKTAYATYYNRKTILYYVKVNNLFKPGLNIRYEDKYDTVEDNILFNRYRNEKNIIEVVDYLVFSDGWKAYLLEQYILKEYKMFSFDYKNTIYEKWAGKTELFNLDIRNKGMDIFKKIDIDLENKISLLNEKSSILIK